MDSTLYNETYNEAYNETFHPFLRAKVQVGSIHGKLNYNQSEKVFHHDDVPKNVRKKVEHVQWLKASKAIKDTNDPRFQPEWNTSIKLDSLVKIGCPHLFIFILINAKHI